jgi:hypothetical protein
MLSDVQNYCELGPAECDALISETYTSVVGEATFADEHLHHLQLVNFLWSKIPEGTEEELVIPSFYVILKIHRTQVKF